MPDTPDHVENLSPHKLLRNFSRNRLLPCLFLALLGHVAVIGGLSVDYIHRTWIDPAAESPDQEAADSADADSPSKNTSAGNTAEKTAPNDGASPDGAKTEAPVVNRVSEKPDPGEIPEDPGGLGLPIDAIKD